MPKESVTSWLAYLRSSYPTFPFRVSSALLPPPEDDTKGKSKVSEKDGLGTDGLVAYFTDAAQKLATPGAPLFVAFVGMPNVSCIIPMAPPDD